MWVYVIDGTCKLYVCVSGHIGLNLYLVQGTGIEMSCMGRIFEPVTNLIAVYTEAGFSLEWEEKPQTFYSSKLEQRS